MATKTASSSKTTTRGTKSAKAEKPVNKNPQPLGPVALTVTNSAENVVATPVTVDKAKTVQYDKLELIGTIDALEPLRDYMAEQARKFAYENGAGKLESDTMSAQICGGGPSKVVNVAKFMKLCEKKKIKDAAIYATLNVVQGRVSFLSDDELASVIEEGEPTTPQFRVERKKDAPKLPVLDAIQKVADEAGAGRITNEMAFVKEKKNGGAKK